MGDTNIDFDTVLIKVSEEVFGESQLQALGTALDFTRLDIRKYYQINLRSMGKVQGGGTLQMLREWRKNAPRSSVKTILRDALLKAKLPTIADKCIPEGLILHRNTIRHKKILLFYLLFVIITMSIMKFKKTYRYRSEYHLVNYGSIHHSEI